MAEQSKQQTAPPTGEPPIFRMQKMYIKDLSFESPIAPGVFVQPRRDPRVDVDLKLRHAPAEGVEGGHEVSLALTVKVQDKEAGDQTLFIIELEHAALFQLRGIPEEHIDRVLSVDAPFMLFPFTRQLVCQLSLDGGFMPFMMEPINFVALYEQRVRQMQEQEKAGKQETLH